MVTQKIMTDAIACQTARNLTDSTIFANSLTATSATVPISLMTDKERIVAPLRLARSQVKFPSTVSEMLHQLDNFNSTESNLLF